ncbi:MAG TPA: biotin/lipoyl-containing protein [Vicinamibacterales bacterium]
MIVASRPRTVRVMLTAFRDGLQSSFGGRVRLEDLLPAMEFAAQRVGIRHFEFGGGARFQAPYFYAGEDPFVCQDAMRRVVGPDVDLQILTRSVSGVTLTTQRLDALRLQASLMKKHGTTWDRNFDYMNDVDNLARTAVPIVGAGMHHQVCVAMMGLPFEDPVVHTPEFYVNVVRQLLKRGVYFDSVCMKDASGTTDPNTCYETARQLKAILPPEVPLWQHTHDTASMAVACYMAGIAGGVDGIDLSVRPMASGTVQPDVRSMWHALKGTGYSLDVDHAQMDELEDLLLEGLAAYELDPTTTTPDARVVGFPMPGGAIGPNVQMMKQAGILDRYSSVLAEFPIVVKAGGAWTSVTPGSQQYWLQAFNNVLHGRWKKIDPGYGSAVLGYFGRTPLTPDPAVVAEAAAQLGKAPFDGDPLQAAPDALGPAAEALRERGLPVSAENVFLVAAAIVPGKSMDLNEGIRLLSGSSKISLPLKTAAAPTPSAPQHLTDITGAFTTSCRVTEGDTTRRFRITIDPPEGTAIRVASAGTRAAEPGADGFDGATPVFSPFAGKAELVHVAVRVGDEVRSGQVVAAVEVMKARHEVRSPSDGRVLRIDAALGTDVTSAAPIMLIVPQ